MMGHRISSAVGDSNLICNTVTKSSLPRVSESAFVFLQIENAPHFQFHVMIANTYINVPIPLYNERFKNCFLWCI